VQVSQTGRLPPVTRLIQCSSPQACISNYMLLIIIKATYSYIIIIINKWSEQSYFWMVVNVETSSSVEATVANHPLEATQQLAIANYGPLCDLFQLTDFKRNTTVMGHFCFNRYITVSNQKNILNISSLISITSYPCKYPIYPVSLPC